MGKKFGSVAVQPNASYQKGEVAETVFWSGNPRSSNPLETTFMAVEKLQNDFTWKVVYKDSNWETKFHWERTSTIKGQSQAHCIWEIPKDQENGVYRFVHMGHFKRITGSIKAYKGYSSTFKVMKS